MKDTKCKCTHMMTEHHKRSVLDLKPRCKICPCNEFFRHDRPDKLDKIINILGITGLLSILMMLVWMGVESFSEHKVIFGTIVITTLFITTLFWDAISDMINNNRRKDWNED